MLCKNVVSCRSGLAEHSDYLVDIANADVALWDDHTDDSLYQSVDILTAAHPHSGVGVFGELEKTMGMTWHKENLLNDLSLRPHVKPASTTMYDQMHVFLVNGLVIWELFSFIAAMKHGFQIGYKQLHDFLKPWQWPKDKVKAKVCQVFNEKREASSKEHVKAGASELLSVYQVFRHFVESIVARSGKLARETKSLLSLFRILDALQCMPRGCVSVAEFHAEVVNHMRYWQEAYPDEDHKPKHHMSVHLGKMYERHGMLWNCFVHERKHKTLKKFATTTSNTLNYEQSVSTDLLNAHVEAMSHPEAFNTGCYLVDPRAFINEIRGHRHECVCWELMQVMVIYPRVRICFRLVQYVHNLFVHAWTPPRLCKSCTNLKQIHTLGYITIT